LQESLSVLDINLKEEIEKALSESEAAREKPVIAGIIGCVVSAVILCIFSILFARTFVKPIRQMCDELRSLAEGDLNSGLNFQRRDEFGEMGDAFNASVTKMNDLISQVTRVANGVHLAADAIAKSSNDLSHDVADQNDQVARAERLIEQMAESVIEVARKTEGAASSAIQSGDSARSGGETVQKTIEGIHEIEKSFSSSSDVIEKLGRRGDEIREIIDVISGIAEQTGLLALNAAIEAARAGEQGRGFAVVAAEVRQLADRTTVATKGIAESILAIRADTEEAVRRMEFGTTKVVEGTESAAESEKSLYEIVTATEQVSEMVQSIAIDTQHQSTATDEITGSIRAITEISARSSQVASETSGAADELSQRADMLRELINQFKLRDEELQTTSS